ncbi:hypothetical protein SYNPS1DRAFT_25176 [Syncephalis pseudoplumigaleata]|uniref:WW domain-containing protein n=1 Tax=Syncephalis pseudoplumigaleata TaxID=1712513 RepID=A0A4P9YSH4_9FUNG|nr:hypothetical protein SYNPS1DRAFT_25176 [Syncephalis pseudoplumigaleata]|eukprot:RKP22893.1 hypothetical protein SYNPS1DRAFT_25176 [Syncephalis pseudoplumigaleata]
MSRNSTSAASSSSSEGEEGVDRQQSTDASASSTATTTAAVANAEDAGDSGALTWGAWQACWDQDSYAYYYWNAETNETTWTCPWGDAAAPTAQPPPLPGSPPAEGTEGGEPYPPMDEDDAAIYADFMATRGSGGGGGGAAPPGGYTASARFNARTGRFQADATLSPENFTIASRMQRQCEAFFDYNNFATERSMGNKRPKLTKQQLERAKKRHKEKREARKRAWLNAID